MPGEPDRAATIAGPGGQPAAAADPSPTPAGPGPEGAGAPAEAPGAAAGPPPAPRGLRLETRLVHAGVRRDPRTGSVAVPIYQTATYEHPGPGQTTGWDYSRLHNPTREAFEAAVAGLEEGFAAVAFASGMAALTAVLHLLRPGDHLVVTEDLYGHTWRVLEELFRHLGIAYTLADTTDAAAVAAALTPSTRAVLVESPTNPLMRVADLDGLAALCRARRLWLVVDSTLFTPLFQRPLARGADVVVHSASKYLAGHNDLVAGVAVAATPALADELASIRTVTGGILGPHDAWLAVRGLKTLALRMERAQRNALTLAHWLAAHPAVAAVYYPGLPSSPFFRRCLQQAAGFGAMLSFRLREPARAEQVLARLRLVVFAESFGGVESLITHPATTTHKEMPAALRKRLGIDAGLLRLSVGIEAVDDLVADLEGALGGPSALGVVEAGQRAEATLRQLATREAAGARA
ncbi:aminotransferase class I/II-fold pyridoxal phosphate-dependent enzyme [Thermaerobacter composti]|uniref:Aminotransferase class I/II-fold pyridoxal phosphate-dependent enzyme n=1 Tax=Thermaerobacter composti TaxID=554949 RepID=A0ABZ0QMT1_9FIRM|nr:aminotransferase class I/II-fold pyridoxal phosphate-dependent enzyme [Thermaerobacter composti]WPD18353.1 aminotransferase class I/II-fold pyridoxal phosphate-dependent enzyme [Thermaerobacter composti]